MRPRRGRAASASYHCAHAARCWAQRAAAEPLPLTCASALDLPPVKRSVYIESSIVSYLAAQPSRDVIVAGRQAITHDWWNNHRHRFELRISVLVEEEINRGDEGAAARRRDFAAGIPSLSISEIAIELGELLLSEAAVPLGSESDALHIGIAAAQGADFLLTWNFRHINNAEMKAVIARVIESRGLVCPQICSPEELGGAENE